MSFYQPRKTYIDSKYIRRRKRSKSRNKSRKRKRSRSRKRLKVSAFRIKAIKQTSTATRFKKLDRRIPYPVSGAFRLLVTAYSSGGKTVLMLNLLREYKKYFDGGIHIFTPGPAQYEKNLKLSSRDNLFSTFDERRMREIYEEHLRKNKERGRIGYMLFVLDDFIMQLSKANSFKSMLLNGRKHGVSFMISTQRFAQTPPLIKMNMSNHVVLTGTDRDLENLSSYVGLDSKELIKAYRTHVAPVKYSFLHIKVQPLGVFLRFSSTKLLPKRRSSRKRRRRSLRRRLSIP